MPAEATVFVDTAVLIYSEDRANLHKHQQARDWLRTLWQRRCGRISTQVMHEFYVTVTRQLNPAMPAGDARAEVRRYQRWQPWVIDHATVETAWALESRFTLRYGHALIAAAALQQGCRVLLTEDMPHDLVMDGLRVVNPFVATSAILDTLQ
jgi:predicted nucleic acid-binding protein